MLSRSPKLYVGNVPAGTYRLSSIASASGNMRYWVNFNDSQASFKVREKQTTDLGRLIATGSGENKVILARSYSTVSNMDYLKRGASEFYGKLKDQQLNGWGSAPPDSSKNVELVSKRYSSDHFNPSYSTSGGMFIGSRMGTLWWNKLDKDKNWSPIDPGSLNAILATLEIAPNELVVAGEASCLAKYDSDRGFVEMDKTNMSPGSIVFLKKYGQHGLILCVSNGKELSFFRKRDIDTVGWEAFGKAEASFDFWWSGQTFSKVVSRGDDIVVATTPDVLHVYSAESGTWAKRQMPKNVTKFAVSYDKRLTMRGMPLPKNYYSDDLGISWHEVPGTSIFDDLVQFSDEKTGYMIGPGEGSTLLSAKPSRLMVTHDMGTTWETVATNFIPRREFSISPDGREMLKWNVYWLNVSHDGGKSWRGVRFSQYPANNN